MNHDVYCVLVKSKDEENRKNKHRGDLRDINKKELGAARIGCYESSTIVTTTSTKLRQAELEGDVHRGVALLTAFAFPVYSHRVSTRNHSACLLLPCGLVSNL